MAVILGSLTNVTVDGVTDGFQSVQWQIQVSTNRLWVLGSWDPYKTQVSKVESVSLSTYAGVLGPVTLTPSTSCTDSDAIFDVVIAIDACGTQGATGLTSDAMFITSYGYSKTDPNGFGTESWSLQKWVDAGVFADPDVISTGAPDFVLQGKSEGSYSGNVTNVGVVLDAANQVVGQQGSVSAGFPGLGNADDITYGFVNQIGGGTLEEAGKVGTSSATIPHQPLYLGQ